MDQGFQVSEKERLTLDTVWGATGQKAECIKEEPPPEGVGGRVVPSRDFPYQIVGTLIDGASAVG
jgi:hypothetical protein